MSKTKISIVVISLVLLSSVLTYFFAPKKVEYKEKIKVVEVVKQEVRTITKFEKRPDGTTTKTITEETINENKKSSSKELSKKITPIKKDWFVTGTYSIDNDYSISVQRRIILDLYAGIYARSDKEIGITVSYSF